MRASEFITEGLSNIVYHYAPIAAAQQILQQGQFQLSSVLGSIEQQYAPKGKHYFLSTTRTRFGGYHDIIGSSAVLFTLDGRMLTQRYQGKSVDYWQNRDPSGGHHRGHEAEDRIFSKDSAMPIDSIIAIDVMVTPDASDRVKAIARSVMIMAKKRGIQSNFYTDVSAWKSGDTRKRGDIGILTGQDDRHGYVSTHKGFLTPWIELIFGTNYSTLGKKAKEIVRSLPYSYDRKHVIDGFSNDLSNARKPNSGIDRERAVKIISYMQKNKLQTVEELVNHIAERWANESK